ncbi:hypothetical protein Q5752_005738 [Cryptotrichosporon argae]
MPRPSICTQAAVLVLAILLVYLVSRPSRKHEQTGVPPVPDVPVGAPSYTQRLVAIGDLHGDIANALRVLRFAGLVNAAGRWAGGSAILVQTGDIVDRGTYALDIYRLFQRLRGEADAAGGRVVSVLGNHEYMNAIGDWRYVTDADIKHFGGVEARQHALSANGWLGQEWLANYSVAALVPLCERAFCPSLSFTHGSLLPSHPSLTPYPTRLNALGRSLLARALAPPLAPPHPPAPYRGLPGGTTPDEQAVYDAGGPLWWRGLAETRDEATVCAWADELKRKTGARRIVGGHTPDFEKIVSRCNGSVIIIDTGISSAYGGVLSALEIVYTLTPETPQTLYVPRLSGDSDQTVFARDTPVEADDDAAVSGRDERGDAADKAAQQDAALRSRWIEREEVHAIYEHKRVRLAVEQRVVS